MNVAEYYAYLSASREQLWSFLRALPTTDLDCDMIAGGERFHCVKDLLLHTIDVEDHWIHTVARGDGVQRAGLYPHDWVTPHAEQYDLNWITEYGREVTRRTLTFLAAGPDLSRPVRLVQDDPNGETVTLEQLLWHVMTHEVRHTAQVVLLVRQLGHTPPWLDYLRFVRPLVPPQQGSTDTGAGIEDEDGEQD